MAAVLLGAASVGMPLHAQTPTFKAGVKAVSLFATVFDANGRLAADLQQDDFEVFDNEKPQPLVLFDNKIQPISVVVLLDTSLSMTGSIKLLQQAAEQFVLRLLPDDSAKVGAFNDKIEISHEFTNNREKLTSAVKDLDFGNATRLWDALGTGLDELKGLEGRRVILVFTDGDDQGSRVGLGHVIDRARDVSVELLDGRKFEHVEVVSADVESDLAILRIKAEKPLPMNSRADEIDAAGYTLALPAPRTDAQLRALLGCEAHQRVADEMARFV